MILVALMVVGVVAYSRLLIQAYPEGFEWRWIGVEVDYEGASPLEVDRAIRQPIEDRMRTVKGYRRIRSSSSASWGMWLGLEFREDADLEVAYNQMTDQLERAKLELPEEARDFARVRKWNGQADWEIIWAGVSVPPEVKDPHSFVTNHVIRPLERIDGVARVDIWGSDEREVLVELDIEKMRTRGVNHFQLVRALRSDNFTLAGGFVREGGKKLYVRSTASYRTVDEIGNIPIRVSVGGNQQVSRGSFGSEVAPAASDGGSYADLRLKDVARISFEVPERRWYAFLNGEPATSIGIFRESGKNIVEVCDAVIAALDDVEQSTGVKLDAFFNQGRMVKASLGNLRNTGVWGGIFAALVLLFFLRTIRMTALITLAIPLCVVIALMGIYVLGWTLNSLTMMGLMLGVGMVVDNAIVIVENIYRRRGEGEDPHEASIAGASEVGLAITMATLTTIVVFLPLMLMGGGLQTTLFLTKMGLPVVFSLLGSLFVALLFIPLAAKRFGDSKVKGEPKSIAWTRTSYLRALNWCLNHRRDAILIVLALSATTLYPMDQVKKGRGGSDFDASQNRVRIRVRGSSGFGFALMDSIIKEVEKVVESKRDVYDIRTINTWYDDDYGQIQLFLHDPPNQEWWYQIYRSTRERLGVPVDKLMDRSMVMADLKKILPQFVGTDVSIDRRRRSEDAGIDVNMYGEDFETLAKYMKEAERRIREIPDIISTDTDLERARPELKIRIDRQTARRMGVTAENVGRSLASMVRGSNLPYLQTTDREIAVRLRLMEEDRESLMQVKGYTFGTAGGEEVVLSSFANFEISQGTGSIRREDGRMRLRIRVTTAKTNVNDVYEAITTVMEDVDMPRGYSWDKGEGYSRLREQDSAMNFAILMAITFVFLLMGVLFESVILPFSVILSIPLAFFGVYWTLWLTNTKMDDMASMGGVVLIGVVVNNAIVLVDMINRLRESGMPRVQAILEAGRNRYRPILMTTFTTVFGLLPMAVSTGNMMGMPYAPLGRTMMGGLISSTFLTLLVVPIFYTLLDDLRTSMGRITAAAFSRSGLNEDAGLVSADD
jgi:hydrophobic/amphiphilic exporter-1 (mainly G- bacteria), HAE1 family